MIFFFEKVLHTLIEVNLLSCRSVICKKKVICEKPLFLHSLNVLIKMFAYSLAISNQQRLGKTNHVHWFRLESCVVFVTT